MLKPIGSLKLIDDYEKQLASDIGRFYNDPLGFVKYVFAWKEGELAEHEGPDQWQTTVLSKIKEELEKRIDKPDLDTAIRLAVASGHGVGKSALVSWLILWFISTRPMCQIVCTANTQSQLSGKTWREVNRWLRLAINRHHFIWTATKLYHVLFPEVWFAAATPWSKDNSEAFAGTHAENVLILFDEASAIDDTIWEVVEGALTTRGSMIFCFGNPTRTTGKFHEAFHTQKHRWITYQVDSRNAKMANQNQIKEWIEDYGEDSDFVKIRIKGEFPRLSASQFISADLVYEASRRAKDVRGQAHMPNIIGVDVARFGTDQSIIIRRQGYLVDPPLKFRHIDVMDLAGRVVEVYRKYPNSIICADGVGIGAGLVDRLKQLGIPVIDVQSAAKAYDMRTYANKRGENWGRMRDWLLAGGCIPNDKELIEQIPAIEYGLNKRLQILLESKEDIRKKGGTSPDIADALSFTFSYDEAKMLATSAKARNIKRVTWL